VPEKVTEALARGKTVILLKTLKYLKRAMMCAVYTGIITLG
jgi:Ni2+-binding GTPase involved in maturation of urease and hydrogenase